MSNPQVTIGVSAVDTARQTLTQVDQKVKETTGIVEQSGTRMASIGDKVKANWQSLATTAAGLGAGITGFATSFSVLEKAKLNATTATITYNKSLERLKEMQEAGKSSAEELANQQDTVAKNAERMRMAQDDVNETYANFLANIPSQLLSFGTAAISMWSMMRAQQTATAVNTRATGFAYTGALAGMNAANVATTISTNTLSAAMKAAFISNPIGLVILGITTVIALLVTHIDEVVGAFQYAGKVIFEFLDKYMWPFATVIRLINGDLDATSTKLGTDVPQAAKTAAGAFDSFGSSAETAVFTAKNALDTLNPKIQETIDLADEAFASITRSVNNLPQTPQGTNDFLAITDTIAVTKGGPGVSVTRGKGNSDAKMQASQRSTKDTVNKVLSKNKNVGGVFVAGKGRVLDSGGTLFENVFGYGTETGTPHLLHKGEDVVPAGKGGRGSGPVHLHFEFNKREFASAVISDIDNLLNKRSRWLMQTKYGEGAVLRG